MKKVLSLIIALAFLMSFLPALVLAEGEPVLTDSAVLRLEAEDYQAQVAGTVVAEVSGYSGGKRLAFTDISGATNLDFSVNVQTEGKYKITVKWGTGSGNANSSIKINGVEVYTCPSGAWKNLATDFEATFSAGINTVTVANTGWGKTLWVDYAEFEILPDLEVLPAGGTLKLEAESYTGQTANDANSKPWSLSNGLRVPMSSEGITFRFEAEAAGTYELKVRWGENNATNTISIKVNDTAITPEFNTFTNWWSGTAYANVTLVQGLNTVAITKNSNIWVDYIQINPVPTLTASSPLRLEAEDYHKGYGLMTRRFGDDAYIFNNTGDKVTTFKAVMNVESAGRYAMDLCAGGFQNAQPTLTVNIDDTPVYTGTVAGSTSTVPSEIPSYGNGVGVTTSAVDLTAGQHTVSVDLPAGSQALMDYIQFSKIVEFSDEVYSYELEDYNVDGGDLSAALVKTYLGNYDPADASTKENASLKALGEGLDFAFYEFTPTDAADYYLKVTYACGGYESPAAVIIDPQSDQSYAEASASPATVVTSGTWLQSYSNDADVWIDESDYEFHAPYFSEKYFDLGALTAGPHAFMFMFNPTDWTNEGVSIRKVELLTANTLDSKIYDNTSFTADLVTEMTSLSKTVTSISDANTYTAASIFPDEQNTINVVKNLFNNTASSATFKVIAASYDASGVLIDVGVSDSVTLAAGDSADVAVMVKVLGADTVKVFGLDMSSLKPILDPVNFGH